MKLDVEVKCAVVAAISWGLMERHNIRKGHAPQVIELHQQILQRAGEVTHLYIGKDCNTRVRLLRRDEGLISVSSKVRKEDNCKLVLKDDSTSIFALCFDDVLKQNSSRADEVLLRRARFGFDCLEYEVGSVYLAVRMRIGNAYDL